jgi:RNA polymerase sigma-70 factor (ECF subfamily)
VDIDDRELVSRVLAGDTDEFQALVQRHQGPVFRFAANMVGNRDDAQETTQDVSLAAFVNLSTFDSARASFSTWLLTITRNRCINLLKRKRTTTSNELNSIAEQASADPIANQELSQKLDQALAALPLKQLSAFVLAEIEELPYAEIARIEQTTIGTVKSRIHRAKSRLRSLLEHS